MHFYSTDEALREILLIAERYNYKSLVWLEDNKKYRFVYTLVIPISDEYLPLWVKGQDSSP